MRRDIVLSGFVLTADEWDNLDALARAQLLRAGVLDQPWLPPIPPLPPARRAAAADEPAATFEPDLDAAPA